MMRIMNITSKGYLLSSRVLLLMLIIYKLKTQNALMQIVEEDLFWKIRKELLKTLNLLGIYSWVMEEVYQ